MKKIKGMNFKWNEFGSVVVIDKKEFYRLLKWLKNIFDINILSHTGDRPKI